MGKDLRYLADGQDFDHTSFGKDFGFTGSAQGYVEKGSAAPPFAKSGPTSSPENLDRFASGGEVGGSANNHMAEGGHPHGHQVVRVHHDPSSGAVIHHHAHGGYTMHHPEGHMTHHGHDGQPAMAHGAHNPGEGTFLSKMKAPAGVGGSMDMDNQGGEPDGDEGGGGTAMARGGHFGAKKPMSRPGGKMPGQQDQPSNRPPRDPMRNPSTRNAMPGGQMPYGVQPSAEPDEPPPGGADTSGGMPQMNRGGQMRRKG